MNTKIFTIFLALIAGVGTLFAWNFEHVQIGNLYYNLDATNQVAEVTSQISGYPLWSTTVTTATIPKSVKYNTITYSVTGIGKSAFEGCKSLTSVTIPESVTSIGERAFTGCKSLTSVTIPNSVTGIGDKAFCGCEGLKSITFPNSVTSIGNAVFQLCSGVTAPIYNAHVFAYLPISHTGAYTIPDGIKQIAGGAFCGCEGLTSVTIPNSVTGIGDEAFSRCGLKSITFPNSVTSIGDDVFELCSGLTDPIYNAHIFAHLHTNHHGEYTIPDGIKQIAGGAFSSCNNLTSVTIPNSVTSIGNYAFESCSGLISITIPDGVTSIGNHAFEWCNGLKSITFPNSVTSIGNAVFQHCSGVTAPIYNAHVFAYLPISHTGAYTIPDGIKQIAGGAFRGCEGLTSVTIPNSVTGIGDGVFYACTSLTSVTIPNSVTRIGNAVFGYCSGLTSVTIGNSVTNIGDGAFGSCSNLTSVTIPNSVTSIGKAVWNGCSQLASIYNYAMEPQASVEWDVIGGAFFDSNTKKTGKLYVPEESIAFYQAADEWKEFKNILSISADNTDVSTTTITTTETTAHIAWPQISGAYSYELVIKDAQGNIVCTLIFDAEGHLLSITFHAPSRENTPQQTQTAGFVFTVTGLQSGTKYDYTLTTKDESGATIKTESGSFTTSGTQGIEDIVFDEDQSNKLIRDGQILILRGNKTYTLTGQEVK